MPGDLHERGVADDCARGLRVEYFLLLATLEKKSFEALPR